MNAADPPTGRLHDGERWLTLGGVRQWVRVAGAHHPTVPLLCLHGGPGGNHWVFERTVGPGLEAARTMIYHEQRGSGRSDAPQDPGDYSVAGLVSDLRELLNQLALPQVDLLGYSFGGGLALRLALAEPARVRRVVAQAPVTDLNDPEVVQSQLSGFLAVAQGPVALAVQAILRTADPPATQLQQVWAAVDTATVDRFLFQDTQVAARNRALWQESGLGNSGELARALEQQAPVALTAALETLRQPVLILAGRHDRNVPLSSLERLVADLPGARLLVFERSAHFPDLEESTAYVNAVLKFLTDQ